jgi:hypothetical protein
VKEFQRAFDLNRNFAAGYGYRGCALAMDMRQIGRLKTSRRRSARARTIRRMHCSMHILPLPTTSQADTRKPLAVAARRYNTVPA